MARNSLSEPNLSFLRKRSTTVIYSSCCTQHNLPREPVCIGYNAYRVKKFEFLLNTSLKVFTYVFNYRFV